jgi:hypothetical protein
MEKANFDQDLALSQCTAAQKLFNAYQQLRWPNTISLMIPYHGNYKLLQEVGIDRVVHKTVGGKSKILARIDEKYTVDGDLNPGLPVELYTITNTGLFNKCWGLKNKHEYHAEYVAYGCEVTRNVHEFLVSDIRKFVSELDQRIADRSLSLSFRKSLAKSLNCRLFEKLNETGSVTLTMYVPYEKFKSWNPYRV